MRRSAHYFAILLAVPLVASCDPSPRETTYEPRNATFFVGEVNDSAVPRLSLLGECELLQDGGRITLYADGTYSMDLRNGWSICGGMPQSGSGRASGVGTYELTQDGITFHVPGHDDIVATYYPINDDTVNDPVLRPFTITFPGWKYSLSRDPSEAMHLE